MRGVWDGGGEILVVVAMGKWIHRRCNIGDLGIVMRMQSECLGRGMGLWSSRKDDVDGMSEKVRSKLAS